jgi:two-component system CheB/CheR fusion protein
LDEIASRRAAKPKSRPARRARSEAAPPPAEIQEPLGQRNFIIGIGSSAGGLEALTQLISNMPADLGVPFVIAQHLSPTHRSLLVQLIERETSMAVREVGDNAPPDPNTVYITPANSNVVYREGRLHLSRPEAGASPRPSVNMFLSSVAEEIGEDAIGVILSGTGTDGAAGIRAIKAAGGFTLAQEPRSAKYNGMPQAAIDTGCVDFVLTPAQIAEEIALLVRSRGVVAALDNRDKAPATLKKLLLKVRQRTKVDFSGYKETTLWRRIERRMVASRLSTLDDYYKFISNEPEELDRLAKDILISVTAFFRDKDAFDRLAETVNEIVKRKRPGEEIRVWVPGCATGEEAYSVAILFAQALKDDLTSRRLQIFATDIDAEAMAVARRAVYPQAALAEMEPALVQRYFVTFGEGYEVAKVLREHIVFARQDLTQDPPFLRLDLITCRNVLIYFQPSLQNSVLPIFHYALAQNGYLFLGKSETVYGHTDKFELVDRKAKVFRRQGALTKPLTFAAPTLPAAANDSRHPERVRTPREVLIDAATKVYLPASVLVNGELEILHSYGDTAGFLEFPTGRPSLNLVDALSRPWRVEAQSLLHRARQKKLSVTGRTRLQKRGDENAYRLAVHPLPDDSGSLRFLVCFEKIDEPVAREPEVSSDVSNVAVKELQDELLSTREHLQTVIEELETSNEEMQALNEELQAANEELQSTNEELETSNEELQSTNEELTTVNDELQIKATELSEVNTDLENVQNSVPYPLVVVDENSRVTRYNELAERLFKLGSTSIGLATSEIVAPFGIAGLSVKIARVLETRQAHEEQVEHRDQVHLLRISPCNFSSRGASGAIVSVVDTTALISAEREVRRSSERLMAVMNNRAALLTVKDLRGRYEFANPAFCEFFGLDAGEVLGRQEYDLLSEDAAVLFRDRDLTALRSPEPIETQDTVRIDGVEHQLLSIRFPLRDEAGEYDAVCTIATDITARVRAEELLRDSESLNLAILDALPANVAVLDQRGRIFLVNEAWRRFARENGAPPEANYWIGTNYMDTCNAPPTQPDVLATQARAGIAEVLAGRRASFALEYPCHAPTQQRWYVMHVIHLGSVSAAAVVVHSDITARMQMENELRGLNHDLEQRVNERTMRLNASNRELEAFAYSVSHDLKAPLRAIAGFSHALADDYGSVIDTQGHDYLKRIIAASTNMSSLIDELLQLSRLARSELHIEPVDLSAMARESCEQHCRANPERKAECLIAPEIRAAGDPRLLRVVVDNLLDNACKFTQPKPLAKIEFGMRERDGKLVYFVRDNGVGFDMSYKDKLFLPFQRLHSSADFPGSGIGLANVWRIVQLHGGEIWAESTQGYGATFYFTLGTSL